MIPGGWRKVSLELVAEVQSGLAVGKKDLDDPVELPYLRVANVQDGFLDLREIKVITVDQKDIQKYLLQDGDVLLTEGGDFDKLGRGTVWHDQVKPCLHQNHVFAVRSNKSKLIPEFLSYQAGSPYGKAYFISCSKQSTSLASVNSTQLKQFPVLLPPIEEQESIISILSTWDKAVDGMRRLVLTKQDRRQALAQGLLFGRTPLRGHRDKRTDVLLSEITKELRMRNSGQLDTESVMAVNKFQGLIPMREHVMASSLERYKVVPPKAFAYNPMRIKIGSLAMSDHSSNVLVSPDYVVFKCIEDRCDPDFLDHYRRTHAWAQYVNAVGNGSVRVRIYYSELSRMKLRLPPIEEQRAISAVLNDAGREIELTKLKLAALQKQKRGLMQKLLTGEWRLKTGKEVS